MHFNVAYWLYTYIFHYWFMFTIQFFCNGNHQLLWHLLNFFHILNECDSLGIRIHGVSFVCLFVFLSEKE